MTGATLVFRLMRSRGLGFELSVAVPEHQTTFKSKLGATTALAAQACDETESKPEVWNNPDQFTMPDPFKPLSPR